jgi:hypothetical protein
LNKSTATFGRHNSGHIFPIIMNVERTPSGFAALVQKVETPEEFILYEAGSFTVRAASNLSLSLLGVTAADVDCGGVLLTSCVRKAALLELQQLLSNTESVKVHGARRKTKKLVRWDYVHVVVCVIVRCQCVSVRVNVCQHALPV